MRRILEPGEVFHRYRCPFCGQIEQLTEGESPYCQNCGELMEPLKDDRQEPKKPETVKDPELDQKPKRKGGRPRKAQPGTCAMCKNALRNNTGYTCEIDWQSHAGSETCPNHKDGVPVD